MKSAGAYATALGGRRVCNRTVSGQQRATSHVVHEDYPLRSTLFHRPSVHRQIQSMMNQLGKFLEGSG
jgi:hypothetical protein